MTRPLCTLSRGIGRRLGILRGFSCTLSRGIGRGRPRDRGRVSRSFANASRCARRRLPRRVCSMIRRRMVHSGGLLLRHREAALTSSALPSISTADEPTRANVKSIPGSGEMSGAIVTAVEPTRANVKSLPGPGGGGPLGAAEARRLLCHP